MVEQEKQTDRATMEDLVRWDDENQEFHARRRERMMTTEPPDEAHAIRFTCGGCHFPLGLGPADGIDGKAWHLHCAAEERARRQNEKGAA